MLFVCTLELNDHNCFFYENKVDNMALNKNPCNMFMPDAKNSIVLVICK